MSLLDPLSWVRRGWNGLRHCVDRVRFMGQRGDYFAYLAVLLHGAQGRLTLRRIFQQDALRHGLGSRRGRLSERWAEAFALTGGDLYATWLGCFPAAELSLVRIGQLSGGHALARVLSELAGAVALIQKARAILVSTLWPALLGMCLLFGMALAIPLHTVPALRQVFHAVPEPYHAAQTRALFGFAAWMQAHGVLLGVACGATVMMVWWSLHHFTGPLRTWLDSRSIWRIYRDAQAVRFLALMAIVLDAGDAASTQLRTALSIQIDSATPWMRWHLDTMLARVDGGLTGADTFDTGLLDRDVYWFLTDMAVAHGLVAAVAMTRDRLGSGILPALQLRAQAMRWLLLLTCVAGMLAMALWHYAVIDELRRALILIHAGQ